MDKGFRAGVEPGGLTTEFLVKLLILYLLRERKEPVSLSTILDAVMQTGSANYFEVVQCACKLMETGHILLVKNDGSRCYAITQQGQEAYEAFSGQLPFTVRERVLEELALAQKRDRIKDSARVKTEKTEAGYSMTLSIRDVNHEMLRVQVVLPTQEICREIEHRFLDDPAVLYKGVVSLLTGRANDFGKLLA